VHSANKWLHVFPREATTLTVRTEYAKPRVLESPDFSRLSCTGARRRIAQLAALGIPDGTIAAITGWSTTDVRRALGKV
jgi:hypothetical protein